MVAAEPGPGNHERPQDALCHDLAEPKRPPAQALAEVLQEAGVVTGPGRLQGSRGGSRARQHADALQAREAEDHGGRLVDARQEQQVALVLAAGKGVGPVLGAKGVDLADECQGARLERLHLGGRGARGLGAQVVDAGEAKEHVRRAHEGGEAAVAVVLGHHVDVVGEHEGLGEVVGRAGGVANHSCAIFAWDEARLGRLFLGNVYYSPKGT